MIRKLYLKLILKIEFINHPAPENTHDAHAIWFFSPFHYYRAQKQIAVAILLSSTFQPARIRGGNPHEIPIIPTM